MQRKIIKNFLAATLAFALTATIAGCAAAPAAPPAAPSPSAAAPAAPVASTQPEVAPSAAPAAPSSKLIVGTNAEFPPFEYVNDKGEIDGFDIAFSKEISNTAGRELQIENMEFKSLIVALQTGQINMIAAGMSVTEERKAQVDFSDTYYVATINIVVKKDNDTIKTGNDLVGKKVGVQEGTTSDFICTDEYANIEVLRFKKNVDAIMELKNGKCDAVVLDSNPAAEFVKLNPDLVIVQEPLAQEEYAIAVKKGDADTLNAVNGTLKKIKENGTYDQLVKTYINE